MVKAEGNSSFRDFSVAAGDLAAAAEHLSEPKRTQFFEEIMADSVRVDNNEYDSRYRDIHLDFHRRGPPPLPSVFGSVLRYLPETLLLKAVGLAMSIEAPYVRAGHLEVIFRRLPAALAKAALLEVFQF
jgi:hypothetical protein